MTTGGGASPGIPTGNDRQKAPAVEFPRSLFRGSRTSDYQSWDITTETWIDFWDSYLTTQEASSRDAFRREDKYGTPSSTYCYMHGMCLGAGECRLG